MRRKMALLLMVCLLCSLLSGYAAIERDSAEILHEKLTVAVDGETAFMGYLVDGIVYVPLRSFCGAMNLGAVVTQDKGGDAMQVVMEHHGTVYTLMAQAGRFYLYLNDRAIYLGADILSHRGNLLVPLIEKMTVPKAFGKGGERA